MSHWLVWVPRINPLEKVDFLPQYFGLAEHHADNTSLKHTHKSDGSNKKNSANKN